MFFTYYPAPVATQRRRTPCAPGFSHAARLHNMGFTAVQVNGLLHSTYKRMVALRLAHKRGNAC